MALWQKKDKDKVIHVNTSALVGLKAALYSKQKDFAKEKKLLFENELKTRQVSDKTSSIWKKAEPLGKKNRTGRKMGGTSHDEKSEEREVSREEEEALERSRRALEAKSALYDRLSKGEGLKELEEEEEAGLGEGPQRYMVDFTRKIVESQADASNEHDKTTPISSTPNAATSDSRGGVQTVTPQDSSVPAGGKEEEDAEEGDWVEYVDSLGRSRRCLREDLEEMKSRDRTLRSDSPSSLQHAHRDMTPEDSVDHTPVRDMWGEDDEGEDQDGEPGRPVEPVHYQSVQGGEVRHHGVGYYAFSTDAEKRKEQMDLLANLREKTFVQREKQQKLQDKRKALLEARLAKVKQRRMRKLQEQGIVAGEDVGESKGKGADEDLADFKFDAADSRNGHSVEDDGGGVASEVSTLLATEFKRAQEKAERDAEERRERKRASHVRPWDKGKVVDPIIKRKRELEEERLDEFAPPSTYSKSSYGQRQPFVRTSQPAVPPESSDAPDSSHCPTSSEFNTISSSTQSKPPSCEESTNPFVRDSLHPPPVPPPPPIQMHPLYSTMPFIGTPPPYMMTPPPPLAGAPPPMAIPPVYGFPLHGGYYYQSQSPLPAASAQTTETCSSNPSTTEKPGT